MREIPPNEPLDTADISITDLFELEDLQHIQDAFAEATGVASIITLPDGTPLTRPSAFCRLCENIIRKTEKGLANCCRSDAVIGRQHPDGPIIQRCGSGGLWDAGASITVGGKHLANWLIGQVKNESVDEEKLISYAFEIGADEQEFRKALREVPVMSSERFQSIARLVFLLAHELSTRAYQNVVAERARLARQQVEKARQESENLSRSVIETAAEGILIVDREFRIVRVNAKLATMLGYSVHEMLGRTMLDLVPAELKSVVAADLNKGKNRGAGRSEYWTTRTDGSSVYLSVSGSPILDENGGFAGMVGMFSDLTERRRAEEGMARLAAIVESSDDAIIGATLDGMITDWNDGATCLYGRGPEEMVGQSLLTLVPPELAAEATAILEAVASGLRVRQVKTVRQRKDGTRFRISLTFSPTLGPDGSIIGASSVARDITDQEETEEALRASEERYRLLFEGNSAGVFRARQGRLLECNEAFCRIFGYDSPAEMYDLKLGKFFASQDRAAAQKLLREKGRLLNHELEMRRRDGTPVTILGNVASAPTEAGQIPTIVGTVLDISEIRKLQNQLLQAQKMEAIGQMAGGIAHDFNNLLMVISSYSELLLDSLIEPHQRKQVEQMLNAARRGADLTGHLLAFSRKQAIAPRVLNLNTVVDDLAKMLPRLMGEDIELQLLPAIDLSSCKADLTQMQQVIMNLVVNARDAMPRGGRLSIATANKVLNGSYPGAPVTVVPGKYVLLSVADTGIGIPLDIQSRIFEPFFTTKELGKGTGLGLSTVYGIVKQNGGYIFVHSRPGNGTVFKVYLPAVQGPAAASPGDNGRSRRAGATQPTPARAPATILYVEDESALREAGTEFLQSHGYAVLCAANGEEALRISGRFEGAIDLLLTDVIMPGKSGFDLAKTIAARRPGISVLYMSGYTENALLRERVEDLAGKYLQKPFSFQQLSRKIAELLRHKTEKHGEPLQNSLFPYHL